MEILRQTPPFKLPAGTMLTSFRGRIIAASPDEPPYFIDVDWEASDGPKIVKTAITAPDGSANAEPVMIGEW